MALRSMFQKLRSKIDLNKVDADELAKLPVVGRKAAEQIIKYRDDHGPFRSWRDIENIPGIPEGFADKLRKAGVWFEGSEKKAA